MFPLGNVLFPRALLPLHVFEPRYLKMMEDIGPTGEFGVTLIERGSEVGGGDTRFPLGTVAKRLHTTELGGGRLAIVALGTTRIRVEKWLDEDPYPRALVHTVPEQDSEECTEELIQRVATLRQRIYGLASEAGVNVGDTSIELSAHPVAATWQLCTVSPVGVLDRQRLLALDDPRDRLELLMETMVGEAEILEAQLAAG